MIEPMRAEARIVVCLDSGRGAASRMKQDRSYRRFSTGFKSAPLKLCSAR